MNDFKYSKLQDLKGKGADAFRDIPSNYFDQLPERIAVRSDQVRRKRRALVITISGIAAGWLIILGFILSFWMQSHEGNMKHRLADGVNEYILQEPMDETADESLVSKSEAHSADIDYADENKNLFFETADLFDELDDIPLEVIVEYIIKYDEFEF